MAGDYVMIQHATTRKIELRRVAAALNITHAHALGLCVLAWMFFDEQTVDGVAHGANEAMLDEVVGLVGFSHALREVGWLRVREGSLECPHFDRLMGESAKKRANAAVRKRRERSRDDDECDSVTNMSHDECDKSVTKGKERKEEREERRNTSHTTTAREADEPPVVKKSKQLKAAIAHWNSYWTETHGEGRPDSPTRIDTALSQKLSAGWSEEKIIESIHASIGWGAKTWRDPDNDFDDQAKGRPNGRQVREPAPLSERC
jgi:hypothetical protein